MCVPQSPVASPPGHSVPVSLPASFGAVPLAPCQVSQALRVPGTPLSPKSNSLGIFLLFRWQEQC